ncbi:MAG TPA: hypothetical protein VHE10_01470 [Candidatus Paceibacterota bacterium]|nr:hypothetical protein [Candidatus Paceibacterota bacterium]
MIAPRLLFLLLAGTPLVAAPSVAATKEKVIARAVSEHRSMPAMIAPDRLTVEVFVAASDVSGPSWPRQSERRTGSGRRFAVPFDWLDPAN